jgi:uncharacterized protein (TIGR01244 family)
MQKTRLLMFLAAIFCTAVFAEDSAVDSSLKVDLGAVVESGVVIPVNGISTAGQPDAAALKVFAEQGYTTVIDLRTEQEDRGIDEVAVIGELGMEYIILPIGAADEISFENAKTLDRLIADAQGPVLIHCGSANRVGALLALSKSLEGADLESALDYGREGGMSSLEGRVRQVLSGQ